MLENVMEFGYMGWNREVKYGPPPFSFYRKDWKLPPQMPIPVIVSQDRSEPRRSHDVRSNIKNLIQLFPFKRVKQPGQSQVYNPSYFNSRPPYDHRRVPFVMPPRRPAPFLPWKSNALHESYLSASRYDEIFQWVPYPSDCVPFAGFY